MSTNPTPSSPSGGRPPERPSWPRNLLFGAVAVALVGTILYLIFGRTPDNKGTDGVYQGKITVGHLVALDMAPMFVAKEAGYFQEEGLDVETRFFANPGDNNAALSGGSIQFSINPFTLHYLAANSGVPVRVISSAGGVAIMQVVAQPEYKIDSMASLAAYVKANKGKKKLRIGALRGDTLEMIVYRGLAEVGLTYDDVEMVFIDDLIAMVEQFRSATGPNRLDVLSHIKPYTTDSVVSRGATVITDNEQVWGKGTPNCTVAVLDDFYNKYPKTVKAYLRAVYRGFDLTITDPERAVDLLERGKYYKVNREVLLYAFKNQPKEVVLMPNEAGVSTCIDDLSKLGYISKTDKKIFYLDPLKEVLAEKKAK